MERALTLFLGNGYSCLCSAGVMIVLIRKKKLFKQPALSPGLRYRVADRTSPGEQIIIQTPVLIKNGEIMECRLLNSKSYILFGYMKEEVTSGGSIFLISFLQQTFGC